MEATTVQLELRKERTEDGISVFKDDNDLLYFSTREDGQIRLGPFGSPKGYKKITIYSRIVECETPGEIMQIFLRGNNTWFSYLCAKTRYYEVYGSPVVLNDDFMQIKIEGCDTQNYAIFLFKENCLVPALDYSTTAYGDFNKCKEVFRFKDKPALLLSRGLAPKSVALYLISENKFFSVPLPKKFKKEGKADMMSHFHFICSKYAVLRFGYDFKPEFFVCDLEAAEYVTIGNDAFKINQVCCTPEYFACFFTATSGLSDHWQVLSVQTWNPVEKTFHAEMTTNMFSEVSVENGKMLLSYEFKQKSQKSI